jgi:hypothetical protein
MSVLTRVGKKGNPMEVRTAYHGAEEKAVESDFETAAHLAGRLDTWTAY